MVFHKAEDRLAWKLIIIDSRDSRTILMRLGFKMTIFFLILKGFITVILEPLAVAILIVVFQAILILLD